MSDDSLSPARWLASANLDNEVTADERAIVEASPELTDESAFYGHLQHQLRAVDVPAAARDSVLAAALAAFDLAQSDPAQSEPAQSEPALAPVVSLRERRQRQYRWLGGAAAATIVGVIAVAALGNREQDLDTAAKSADTSAEIAVDTPDAPAADVGPAPAETIGAPDETAAAYGGEDSEPPDAAGGAATTMAASTLPILNTPDDVAAFVANDFQLPLTTRDSDASAEMAPAETTAPAATEAPAAEIPQPADSFGVTCAFADELPSAQAIYRGVLVVIRRNDELGVIEIVDAATCVVELALAALIAARALGSKLMPGNPLNDPNWAPNLADSVERFVGSIRDKTTKPVLTILRGLIFGVIAVSGAGVAGVLLTIAVVRALQDLIDLVAARHDSVWISYLAVGALFTAVGLVLLKKRFPVDEPIES